MFYTQTELFIKGNLLQNANYEITSIEGKPLQKGIMSGDNISIEYLKVGFYFIKIRTAIGEKVQRFVKE